MYINNLCCWTALNLVNSIQNSLVSSCRGRVATPQICVVTNIEWSRSNGVVQLQPAELWRFTVRHFIIAHVHHRRHQITY